MCATIARIRADVIAGTRERIEEGRIEGKKAEINAYLLDLRNSFGFEFDYFMNALNQVALQQQEVT